MSSIFHLPLNLPPLPEDLTLQFLPPQGPQNGDIIYNAYTNGIEIYDADKKEWVFLLSDEEIRRLHKDNKSNSASKEKHKRVDRFKLMFQELTNDKNYETPQEKKKRKEREETLKDIKDIINESLKEYLDNHMLKTSPHQPAYYPLKQQNPNEFKWDISYGQPIA